MPDGAAPVVLLPGILMPAAARFGPLVALIPHREAWLKDLEVYAGDAPPSGYTLDEEVSGLLAFIDSRGAGRVHLYGHSGGASIAMAFAALHGDRVLSLGLDEPATDFSEEDRQLIQEAWPGHLEDLPVPERMRVFARALVRPGVEPPSGPPGPPSPEMGKRPAGLAAFEKAVTGHRIDDAALSAFPGPVYFSYGSLSNARWELMADRVSRCFQQIEVERYAGLHHLNTSHVAEPARVAAALQELWTRAEDAAH